MKDLYICVLADLRRLSLMTMQITNSKSGKGVTLREGKDLTIVATGLCVSASLEAFETGADGVNAKVINIHTIKPLDEELIIAAAKETGKVVTVEENIL